MAVSPAPLPVTGRVDSVNDTGIKVDGQWHNVSKFASDVVMPSRGDMVTLTLDRSGFVRSVQIGTNGSTATPAQKTAVNASSARDTTITRLAVLKAAAEYCASKQESKSADVLAIATSWEAWVNRPEPPELEEAF